LLRSFSFAFFSAFLCNLGDLCVKIFSPIFLPETPFVSPDFVSDDFAFLTASLTDGFSPIFLPYHLSAFSCLFVPFCGNSSAFLC